MEHDDRTDTVLYVRLPKAMLADLDRLIERERKAAKKDSPYQAAADLSRSVLVRRALTAMLVESGLAKVG